MKTAKQIKEAAMVIRYMETYVGEGINLVRGVPKGYATYVFTPDEIQAFEEAICTEQRELCVTAFTYNSGQVHPFIKNEIRNAPKPTT